MDTGLSGGEVLGDFIMVKALEDGVTIIGLTRVKKPNFTIRKSWTRAK